MICSKLFQMIGKWRLYAGDIHNFGIRLKIGGQIGTLSDLKSRKVYDYFIRQFQEDYNLQVRDGHNQYNYDKEEIKDIFLRLRSAVICSKHREFQYKSLHGALYTKEHLYRFGFVPDKLCSFVKRRRKRIHTYFCFVSKSKEPGKK